MQDILYGFTAALSLTNLIASVLSVIVGIAVGSLPGLSAAMGVALLIPITFGMPPETALIALAGVYVGAMFGGSISAILLHTPGTSSAAATAIDGYPMTLKGEAGKAIAAASWASFIGGIISAVALYTLSPLLAKLALQFGPTEYFWLSIFGLTIIAGVSSKSMLKGLISGALGLVLSTIGMDPMLGTQRFIFGSNSLLDGLPFTATLIGLATSIITNLIVINKTIGLDLKLYFKKMFKFVYPLIIMIIVLLIMKNFISLDVTSKFSSIALIAIYALVGAGIYFALTIKNGIFKDIFGDKLLKKIKK